MRLPIFSISPAMRTVIPMTLALLQKHAMVQRVVCAVDVANCAQKKVL